MPHNLFLGMYTFQIQEYIGQKQSNKKRELQTISINDFLSKAYTTDRNKFSYGFVEDFIKFLDKKAFKTKTGTHGGTLVNKSININKRYLDLLIDGGLTGIKQYIIKEGGEEEEFPKDGIIGPRYFARIWLPGGTTQTGYIFLQKYGAQSIKPIFDEILKDLFKNHNLVLSNRTVKATTTKERMKSFLKTSTLKNIKIISNESSHQTSVADAKSAEIILKNVKTSFQGKIQRKDISKMLKKHGIYISKIETSDIKATYENIYENNREEKTVFLDSTEETINIVPNIIIPPSCIDSDNFPIFNKMQEFVDKEIVQIQTEAKI